MRDGANAGFNGHDKVLLIFKWFLNCQILRHSLADDCGFSAMVPEKLPETPFWFILCAPAGLRLGIPSTGEMAEWFKVHAWKACVRLQPYRGFESLSLRHLVYAHIRSETRKP